LTTRGKTGRSRMITADIHIAVTRPNIPEVRIVVMTMTAGCMVTSVELAKKAVDMVNAATDIVLARRRSAVVV
jgi:hypothetical protein